MKKIFLSGLVALTSLSCVMADTASSLPEDYQATTAPVFSDSSLCCCNVGLKSGLRTKFGIGYDFSSKAKTDYTSTYAYAASGVNVATRIARSEHDLKQLRGIVGFGYEKVFNPKFSLLLEAEAAFAPNKKAETKLYGADGTRLTTLPLDGIVAAHIAAAANDAINAGVPAGANVTAIANGGQLTKDSVVPSVLVHALYHPTERLSLGVFGGASRIGGRSFHTAFATTIAAGTPNTYAATTNRPVSVEGHLARIVPTFGIETALRLTGRSSVYTDVRLTGSAKDKLGTKYQKGIQANVGFKFDI
jgi:hypothetical protein